MADAHIRYQYTYCDLDRGAHYDIHLKFENRFHWGIHLLSYLHLQNDPVFEGFIEDSQIPFKGADTVEVILQHYTKPILDQVKELYAKDIEVFGYEEDVKMLEQIIVAQNS